MEEEDPLDMVAEPEAEAVAEPEPEAEPEAVAEPLMVEEDPEERDIEEDAAPFLQTKVSP